MPTDDPHSDLPRDDLPTLLRVLLTSGLPFGLAEGAFIGWLHGPVAGVACGLAGGLMFGVLFHRLLAKGAARRLGPPPGDDGPIHRTGPANHFVGWEGVGGTLHLTDRCLFFESHGMNVRDHELRIALADITAVSPARTLGIVPNGLLVQHRGGRERFVVNGRKAWVAAIEAARRA